MAPPSPRWRSPCRRCRRSAGCGLARPLPASAIRAAPIWCWPNCAGHHCRRRVHPQQCPGAPVDWCRDALSGGQARALVVNAGNANVFTGAAGRRGRAGHRRAAAGWPAAPPEQIFLASTGVIGEVLPHARITAALPSLHAALRADGWDDAARGIMTTDTFPKAATRTAVSAARRYTSPASPRAAA